MSEDVASPALRIRTLIDQLLDRGYAQATGQVIRSIARDTSAGTGIIGQRLTELQAESARLAAEGEKLKPDNPILRALVADLDAVLRRAGARIDGAGGDLQQVGVDAAGRLVRQLALPGLDDQALARIGIRWNVPDPEQVNALVNYIDRPAWVGEIGNYPASVLQVINNTAVRASVEGWGPIRTASEITRLVESFPSHKAQVLMRTLQLESWRSAQVAHQVANAHILVEQIRIGTLDDRICLACLSLHGTVMRLNEKVFDHHAGRCTSINIVRGRPRFVQTGEDWFNSLPQERQRRIAGHANYEALNAGAVQLRDFVEPYSDPVFDDMIREASLKGLIGDEAQGYYLRPPQ